MTSRNLSKEKREKLIAKIQEQALKVDDETRAVFNEVINELNKKKYGLVWEEHSEEVEDEMQTKIPVFVEDKKREIKCKDNESYNFILEGDNLHSLKLLEKTHKNKIDVIYIDPPYNTGNDGFIYNDSVVGSEDAYRHSKWLSFLERRLSISRRLLKEDGVIFISIDDNEQSQLKLLCDEIFGNNNFLANIIVTAAPAGTQSSTDFAQQQAYCLVYRKSEKFKTKYIELTEEEKNKKYNQGEDELGKYYIERLWKRGIGGKKEDVPSLHFPVWFNEKTEEILIDEEINKKKKEDYVEIIPYQTAGVLGRWTWSREKMINEREYLKVVKVAGEWKLHKKVYSHNDLGKKPYTIINSSLGRTELGSLELKDVMGEKVFEYPKFSGLIKYFISLHNNKNSIVLDYFAGSGTTGQAVLELNKEDGGNRQFILCTNNENKICEEVTYQRIKTVILGKRKDGSKYSEGINSNLKYYKHDFINKEYNGSVPKSLMNCIKELIQLENHCDINNKTIRFALTEDELDETLDSDLSKCKKLFIPTGVLLSAKQKGIIKRNKIEIIYIPDYYFSEELQEVYEI